MTSKIGRLLLVIIPACLLVATARSEKKKIVVGDPKTHWSSGRACRGHAPNYADTISKSLRARLVETGVFAVISRGQLQKLLQEHNMAMSGLSDPSSAKALGQFLQADLVMATEVLCHPNIVELNIILVDVESAEILWAKNYKMKNLSKVNRAMKDIIKLMKKYTETGSIGASAGKSEDLMMFNSKALRDASESILRIIENRIPRVTARIEEVNVYEDTIKVRVLGNIWPGLKLKVVRDDEEIGWIYLKEKGSNLVNADTQSEMSAFEEGDRASSEDFRPMVVIGHIEDEDEDNEKLVDMFKEGLIQEIRQAERIQPMEDTEVDKILARMGKQLPQKYLAKLFDKGVDLIITGRFSGESGNRRIDFDVLSVLDGKRVTKIKYNSKL